MTGGRYCYLLAIVLVNLVTLVTGCIAVRFQFAPIVNKTLLVRLTGSSRDSTPEARPDGRWRYKAQSQVEIPEEGQMFALGDEDNHWSWIWNPSIYLMGGDGVFSFPQSGASYWEHQSEWSVQSFSHLTRGRWATETGWQVLTAWIWRGW